MLYFKVKGHVIRATCVAICNRIAVFLSIGKHVLFKVNLALEEAQSYFFLPCDALGDAIVAQSKSNQVFVHLYNSQNGCALLHLNSESLGTYVCSSF